MTIAKDAGVHEATVQQAEQHAARNARRRKRAAPVRTPVVTVTKAHPLIEARIKQLRRPGQRVRIISPTEVIIENVPDV